MGKKAQKNFLPMQPGDVPRTYADVDDLITDVGFKLTTTIEQEIAKFVQWYKDFYSSQDSSNGFILKGKESAIENRE